MATSFTPEHGARSPSEKEVLSIKSENSSYVSLHITAKNDMRCVGFALIDIEQFFVQLREWRDDSCYSQLEGALLQCRPTECYIEIADEIFSEQKKLLNIGSRCDCSVTTVRQREESSSQERNNDSAGIEDLFETRYKSNELYKMLNKNELVTARLALRRLTKKLNLFDDPELYLNQFTFKLFPIDKVLRLDKAAFSALNLLPQPGERSTDPTSLFGLLNKCRTSYGTNRLRTWICQPSLSIDELEQRLDIVELLIQHKDLRLALQQNHLRLIPHLDKTTSIFRKSAKRPTAGMLQQVLNVNNALTEIYNIAAILEALLLREEAKPSTTQKHHQSTENVIRPSLHKAMSERLLEKLKMNLRKTQKFHDLVDYTLDSEEAKRGHAIINRDFDHKLAEVAEQRDKCWRKMEKHRRQVEDDLGLVSDGSRKKAIDNNGAVKLIECISHGYVFRVTRKDQKYILQSNKRNKYRQVRINKAEFQFTTQELTSLASSYQELTEQCETQQAELAIKTVSAAVTYWPVLEQLVDLLAQLDVLCAFAEIAMTPIIPYVRPVLLPDNSNDQDLNKQQRRIFLEESRHPLLEAAAVQFQQKNRRSHVVANTVDMEYETGRVQLITGPNMGGKSTYIRQTALICLMAQMGCYVPCKSAKLSLIDAILCRVGASDDQIKGISTFLAEMIEAGAVLKGATDRSLVLIDELGRGTSTYEGFGLAWEITRTIAEDIRCFCLFATHFHELGELPNTVSGVVNRRVQVQLGDDDKLAFLYRVEPGCADVSYGVRIAELVGLRPSVVENAKKRAAVLEEAERRLKSMKKKREDTIDEEGEQNDSAISVRKNIKKICENLHLSKLYEIESPIELMEYCFKTPLNLDVCA